MHELLLDYHITSMVDFFYWHFGWKSKIWLSDEANIKYHNLSLDPRVLGGKDSDLPWYNNAYSSHILSLKKISAMPCKVVIEKKNFIEIIINM